jgi:hypothetical protein
MSRRSHLTPFLTLVAAVALATTLSAQCIPPSGPPLPIDSTWRQPGALAAAADHTVDVLGTGVLALAVSALPGGGEAVLTFLGELCGATGVATIVEETPSSVAVRVLAAATFAVAVAPEDATQPLAGYKVWTSFEADPPVPDEQGPFAFEPPADCTAQLPGLSSVPFGGGYSTTHLDDVDPYDPDVIEGLVAEPGVLVLDADVPVDATLFDGSGCETESIVDGGALAAGLAAVVYPGTLRLAVGSSGYGGAYQVTTRHYAVCQDGETDDHGGSVLCPTPLVLGESAEGVLSNPYGDDEDFLSFVLTAQEAVEILLTGGGSLTLYDGAGQRLEKGATRIVRTLGRGRYHVRVADGDGVSYLLTATAQ